MQDYVSFYCRTCDPWYIKKLKMEVLTAIACNSNVYEIVNELTEYARDISPSMAREAVKAVGRIALAVRGKACLPHTPCLYLYLWVLQHPCTTPLACGAILEGSTHAPHSHACGAILEGSTHAPHPHACGAILKGSTRAPHPHARGPR